ncbi:CCHC-type domain-containing protein [Caerostris darwini]|uniref:CCHC-type domain-containing protein n=1 Tax=Caerostris darwini TaxID=1538125 RepID=A0AAV4NUT3_9ARAC|nr:CCHC-type domain-containing protein [Caerostris darwini]
MSRSASRKSRPSKKGGIIIEAVEEEDLDNSSRNYKTIQLSQRTTRSGNYLKGSHISFAIVSEELTTDAIKANIMHQCHIDSDYSGAISIVHSYIGPRGTNWIFEISPDLFKKLNHGWERVPIREYIKPQQCFKCGQFGHLAKQCAETKDICTKCGGHDHQWRDCIAQPKCVNCTKHNSKFNSNIPTSHSCTERSCPAYIRETKNFSNRTDYGQ